MNRDIKPVMSTKDVQAYLGLGKDKTYALMKNDSFPSIKLGNTYIVTYDNLKAWLEQSTGREINL